MIESRWSPLVLRNARTRVPSSSSDGRHCRFLDVRVAIEGGFDLAELDAIAALLDHAVAAAQKAEVAVGLALDDVAGAVPARAVGVFEEHAAFCSGRFQ